MSELLLIYAHPSPNRSRVNAPMFHKASRLDEVEARDLYELYPDMYIDVQAEQEALLRADTIVFQFPVFWFSSPAILKEWQDSVLTSGFAYGQEHALKGKKFMLAVTSGGSFDSYKEDAKHGAPIETYLAPFEQTARFCDMHPLNNFVVQDASTMDSEAVARTVQAYVKRLQSLVKDQPL